jgi:branched-chain amino acid transport system permease protein
VGTVLGPVVGAVIFTQLPESLRFIDEWRLVIYGAILVLLVRFLPRGLWGSLVRWTTDRRRHVPDLGRLDDSPPVEPVGAASSTAQAE